MNTLADLQYHMEGFPPVKTQCGCCGKIINLTDAVVSTHIISPHITEVEHFCTNKCAEIEWRMR